MYSLCLGCMKVKESHTKCPYCGFDDQNKNGNHQLPLGTIVGGQYILGKVLGQGGFGITYLGWDRVTDQRVAIKEYFPSGYAGRNGQNPLQVTSYDNHDRQAFENNKKRFLREAESLAKLWEVPQIVKVLRHFEENGTAYIAMEYVEGSDLRKFQKNLGRPMTMAETMQILAPVMEGLTHVHDAGLIHRDISPDNIMVLPDGRAKLLDFGAARYVENADAEHDRNTSTQTIMKHGFTPPEQYRSHGALGPWSDVYAMCATIYYCLTGKIPPEAMGRTMENEQIEWGSIPGLSEKQKAALTKGMEIQPKNRFASIEELRNALCQDLPEPLKKQIRETQTEAGKPSPVLKADRAAAKTKKRKRKWKSLLLGILLGVFLTAFTGMYILQQVEATHYTYEENESGITITGAYGWDTPSILEIPGKIDGKRVTAIGPNAFKYCLNLSQVKIPVGVERIEESAFANCRSLAGITIPNTVCSIGNYAFQNCTGLTGISVPSSVRSIGSYAFASCSNLSYVSLAKGVQTIGQGVFQNCVSLTEIQFPESVAYVNKNTFQNCGSLHTVFLPEGVRTIGDHAFYQCIQLQTLYIPGSVSYVGQFAFYECPVLTAVTVPLDCRVDRNAFPNTCIVNYSE